MENEAPHAAAPESSRGQLWGFAGIVPPWGRKGCPAGDVLQALEIQPHRALGVQLHGAPEMQHLGWKELTWREGRHRRKGDVEHPQPSQVVTLLWGLSKRREG